MVPVPPDASAVALPLLNPKQLTLVVDVMETVGLGLMVMETGADVKGQPLLPSAVTE